jgi:alkylhydroperoxidase family enzyme
MNPRLNPYQAAPEAMKSIAALEAYVQSSGLEPSLIELVKARASQINGCAFYMHMHTEVGVDLAIELPRLPRASASHHRRLRRHGARSTGDARARSETEEQLYRLDAWRESPLHTERERAALTWTEAVTLVSQTHVPDAVYEEVRKQFAEDELVKLTHLVATINVWNRIAISFRLVHPVKSAHAAA